MIFPPPTAGRRRTIFVDLDLGIRGVLNAYNAA
jgi:hypothetical protein